MIGDQKNTMKRAARNPSVCKKYKNCGAPLCPEDENLAKRIWYSDEKICESMENSKKFQWIKKQRSISKRQNPFWLNKPIHFQELLDACHFRQLSLEALFTSPINVDDETNINSVGN